MASHRTAACESLLPWLYIIHKVWIPDWIIANAAGTMKSEMGIERSWVHSNGTVSYTVRVVGKLRCPMDFSAVDVVSCLSRCRDVGC